MVDEITDIAGGQFGVVFQLFTSSLSLQIAFIILVVGIITIMTIYRKFARWIQSQKFNYTKPHLAKFIRLALLPFFAIVLVSSINIYIQIFELFREDGELNEIITPQKTFAKILNTLNIIIVGYTISQLIPIILDKHEKLLQELNDFEIWKNLHGFVDDNEFFYSLFKWTPPKTTPDDMTTKQFKNYLQTNEGKKILQKFRTSKGLQIGEYSKLVKNPFKKWNEFESIKYLKYYDDCITGNNKSGNKLKPGNIPEEIYQVDIWKEQKRLNSFEPTVAGAKPPGYYKKISKGIPKPAKQVMPIGIFVLTVIAVISWWGIDLVVLATATGGLGIGIGLALKETMENYFAYILIRKDKVLQEGNMIKLESGYRGYVHKITPRVTYIRHPLNESLAVVPTRHLVSNQITNYTNDVKLFPVAIKIGVSYLNDPKHVAAILMKIGKRAMIEIRDEKSVHLIRQNRCPYVNENRQSCGCDKDAGDINQPIIRFDKFNESSLDFTMYLYVKDYGTQFKVKSSIYLIVFDEFKKYDIRIPWPIRTIYQGNEKIESSDISKLDDKRNSILKEFGIGDLENPDNG